MPHQKACPSNCHRRTGQKSRNHQAAFQSGRTTSEENWLACFSANENAHCWNRKWTETQSTVELLQHIKHVEIIGWSTSKVSERETRHLCCCLYCTWSWNITYIQNLFLSSCRLRLPTLVSFVSPVICHQQINIFKQNNQHLKKNASHCSPLLFDF